MIKIWLQICGLVLDSLDALTRNGIRPRHSSYSTIDIFVVLVVYFHIFRSRATENRFFAGSDRFLVCKTDSICIKRIFFGPKKTHFADHILAQFPGLVKCHNRSQLVYSSLSIYLFFACTEAVKLNFWHNQHQWTLSNLLSILGMSHFLRGSVG